MAIPEFDSALLVNQADWVTLKNDRGIGVFKNTLDNGQRIIIKTFNFRSFSQKMRFKYTLKKLTRFYKTIASKNIPVPRLLSVNISEIERTAYFIYDYLAGSNFCHLDWPMMGAEEIAHIGRNTGMLLRYLHGTQWAHGDCKFGNFMYDKATGTVSLIDLEGITKSSITKASAFGRDLARFILNGMEQKVAMDLLRYFWLSYRGARSDAEIATIRKYAKIWLFKLRDRHQKKYNISADISSLALW